MAKLWSWRRPARRARPERVALVLTVPRGVTQAQALGVCAPWERMAHEPLVYHDTAVVFTMCRTNQQEQP